MVHQATFRDRAEPDFEERVAVDARQFENQAITHYEGFFNPANRAETQEIPNQVTAVVK